MEAFPWKVMIDEGGFASLAAVALFLLYKMAQLWVADVKSGAERERENATDIRELHKVTLGTIVEVQKALASLTEEVRASGGGPTPRMRRSG